MCSIGMEASKVGTWSSLSALSAPSVVAGTVPCVQCSRHLAIKRSRQWASSVRVKGQSEGYAFPLRDVMCEELPAYWRKGVAGVAQIFAPAQK
jgi:hypothetical protein